MVEINVPIQVAYYSFGGWKGSLLGDSHAHGPQGVRFFTRGKVITSRWLDPTHGGSTWGCGAWLHRLVGDQRGHADCFWQRASQISSAVVTRWVNAIVVTPAPVRRGWGGDLAIGAGHSHDADAVLSHRAGMSRSTGGTGWS